MTQGNISASSKILAAVRAWNTNVRNAEAKDFEQVLVKSATKTLNS
jgi:hypothetical protein